MQKIRKIEGDGREKLFNFIKSRFESAVLFDFKAWWAVEDDGEVVKRCEYKSGDERKAIVFYLKGGWKWDRS